MQAENQHTYERREGMEKSRILWAQDVSFDLKKLGHFVNNNIFKHENKRAIFLK